jgi:ATP synthase protein I
MQLALAMELPFILVAGVVIGGGFGYLLDRWLHTSPAFILVFGIIGFAGGVWDIIKRLSRDTKDSGSGGSDTSGTSSGAGG